MKAGYMKVICLYIKKELWFTDATLCVYTCALHYAVMHQTLDWHVPAFPGNLLCDAANHLTPISQANKPQECSSGKKQVNTTNGWKSLVFPLKTCHHCSESGWKTMLSPYIYGLAALYIYYSICVYLLCLCKYFCIVSNQLILSLCLLPLPYPCHVHWLKQDNSE